MLARKLALLKTLHRIGWRRVFLVARHRRRMRSGYYERACPARDWPVVEEGRSPFAFDSGDADASRLLAKAEKIVAGELCYFSWKWLPKPTTWRENPATTFSSDLTHWSRLRDFDERQGDVKWIWEPSRFDWAVTLARAFAATGEERFRATFLELLRDWRAQNPPNQGINWYCAQECSLRMLGLVFAAGALAGRTDSADPRPTTLDPSEIWSTIAALAERIEPSIDYAIGQHNNHGISEAMGLYLGGMCLPGHPLAPRWRKKGKELLCRSILEQFAPDGSYVQHSFIYQRLAMRCCLACFHAARTFGDAFPKEVEGRVLQSARFLYEMMVSRTPPPRSGGEGAGGLGVRAEPMGAGRLPNYGANDGANALCLSDCDYLDFRPVIQLAFAMLADERAFGEGPWDEELAWYGIDVNALTPLPSLPERENGFAASDGGYYVLRSSQERDAHENHRRDADATEVYAFMRVPRYTDGRPSQADALHADVWFDGEPVAVDTGTYSYNDPEGWWKHFKSTAAHNTVVVDKRDQMPSAGRFLYTDWTWAREIPGEPEPPTADSDAMVLYEDGELCSFITADGPSVCGVSEAYSRRGKVVHHRVVHAGERFAMVCDYLSVRRPSEIALIWHLAGEWLPTPQGAKRASDGLGLSIVRQADDEAEMLAIPTETMKICCSTGLLPDDVVSERYGETTPITRVTATFSTAGNDSVTTFIGVEWDGSEEDR